MSKPVLSFAEGAVPKGLGPEGGVKPVLSEVEGGGEIVAVGTPEQVVKEERGFTGAYLRPLLERGKNTDAASPDPVRAEERLSEAGSPETEGLRRVSKHQARAAEEGWLRRRSSLY